MVTSKGKSKVLDFGLARVLEQAGSRAEELDRRSDVWWAEVSNARRRWR